MPSICFCQKLRGFVRQAPGRSINQFLRLGHTRASQRVGKKVLCSAPAGAFYNVFEPVAIRLLNDLVASGKAQRPFRQRNDVQA